MLRRRGTTAVKAVLCGFAPRSVSYFSDPDRGYNWHQRLKFYTDLQAYQGRAASSRVCNRKFVHD